jgi:hypothetical protein
VLKPRSAWIMSYHSLARSSSLGDYIAMTSWNSPDIAES